MMGQSWPVKVYPRGCGGTIPSHWQQSNTKGLSPRVRGNRWNGGKHPANDRSIPAGAGEPRLTVMDPEPLTVYPRGCGGTRDIEPHVLGRDGSIPAGAGEPPGLAPRSGSPGVYPRGCGGTSHPPPYLSAASGLSPRVRGNRGQIGGFQPLGGSIPAGAGEPPMARVPVRMRKVYPRGCGGNRLTCSLGIL